MKNKNNLLIIVSAVLTVAMSACDSSVSGDIQGSDDVSLETAASESLPESSEIASDETEIITSTESDFISENSETEEAEEISVSIDPVERVFNELAKDEWVTGLFTPDFLDDLYCLPQFGRRYDSVSVTKIPAGTALEIDRYTEDGEYEPRIEYVYKVLPDGQVDCENSVGIFNGITLSLEVYEDMPDDTWLYCMPSEAPGYVFYMQPSGKIFQQCICYFGRFVEDRAFVEAQYYEDITACTGAYGTYYVDRDMNIICEGPEFTYEPEIEGYYYNFNGKTVRVPQTEGKALYYDINGNLLTEGTAEAATRGGNIIKYDIASDTPVE